MGIAEDILDRAAERRAEQILGYAHAWLRGPLLDVGCGDASITHHFARRTGIEVVGVDVVDNCRYPIAFQQFDGGRLPFEDDAFDTVMAAFVLHHASDPEQLLAECCRVARRRVLLFEDVYRNAVGLAILKAVDYLGNACVHRLLRTLGTGRWEEMNIPFAFRTDAGWRRLFSERGLRLVHAQEAILDRIDPVRHLLYVLELGPPAETGQAEVDHDADRAIDAMHQRELEAARSGDTAGLVELWDADGTILPPEGPPVVGIDAIRTSLASSSRQRRFTQIVHYDVDVVDCVVVGTVAYEWGRYEAISRPRNGGSESAVSGKLLRVLRRQDDGTWRIARSIWTRDR